MSSLKNHVQLIGHVGDAPKVTELENGNKVVNFSLATNEYFKNKDGEKKTATNWHNIVAWGRTAEIISMYVGKGKEIGICGRLKNRSYESETGDKRYVTEVEANEVLLMGTPETKS